MGFRNHVHHHLRNLKVVLAGAFASIYNSLFDCYPLIACCLMQTRYCFLLMQSDQGMIVPISRKSYCPCIYSLLEHGVINLIVCQLQPSDVHTGKKFAKIPASFISYICTNSTNSCLILQLAMILNSYIIPSVENKQTWARFTPQQFMHLQLRL